MNGTVNDDFTKETMNAGDLGEQNNFVGQAKIDSRQEVSIMPLAVVGMACRLPGGAYSIDDFWQMCALGRSA